RPSGQRSASGRDCDSICSTWVGLHVNLVLPGLVRRIGYPALPARTRRELAVRFVEGGYPQGRGFPIRRQGPQIPAGLGVDFLVQQGPVGQNRGRVLIVGPLE